MAATKRPPMPGAGRPKGSSPPRRTMTVRLDEASIEWIQQNVPRSVSISSFVNEAVREKITRERRRHAGS